MAGESYPVKCLECGHEDFRTLQGETALCVKCGEKRFRAVIELVEQSVTFRDELDATVINQQGDLVAERLQRGDGNTEASLATDRGQPTILSGSRKERVDGFQEEGQAAEALAKAYNERHGTQYSVKPKKQDDYDYADRLLESKADEPRELNIQVRHLDTDVIARLGKSDEFGVKRTAGDLIALINQAIVAKAAVDPKIKPKTILLLQLPAMLGSLIRQEIQQETFDFKGFRSIWIAPFRDECFEVHKRPRNR